MALKTQAALFRNIRLLQGGADAFAEIIEPTSISPSAMLAWLIRRVEVMIPNSVAIEAIAADFSIAWALSRQSSAALADLSDPSTIMADGFGICTITSGLANFDRLHVWTPPDGVLVATPNLYATIDSTGTSLTLDIDMRVYYEEVKISEVELLRMLTQG